MNIFLIILFLFFLSFSGTYLVQKFALKKSILDIPTERSSHTIPTPKGGGFAILVAWLIGIVYFFLINKIPTNLFIALICGIPLAIVGLLDDIIGLSPKIRLIFQFFTVLTGLYFLGGIEKIDFGFFILDNIWLLSILGVLGMIWFINLFNFLDGIDGYAAMEAIFISMGLYIFLHDSMLLLLSCVVLGFLYWNWPRAKIFMGDVGSMLLGYTLVILGIHFNKTYEFSLLQWMMLSSLFWFDATLTIYRRWKNKETLSIAHNNHAYQRIVKAGFSHQKTIIYSIFVNLIILCMVWFAKKYHNLEFLFFIINIVGLYIIVKLIDKKEPFPYTKK